MKFGLKNYHQVISPLMITEKFIKIHKVYKVYNHDEISIRKLKICHSIINKPFFMAFKDGLTKILFPKNANIVSFHKYGEAAT